MDSLLLISQVQQVRTFRSEVEDNYPACTLITTPWKDEKKQPGLASEIETENDVIPTKKQTRELSSSTSDEQDQSQSIYKEHSSSESSNPFAEWLGITNDDESDSNQNNLTECNHRRKQVSLSVSTTTSRKCFTPQPLARFILTKNRDNKVIVRFLRISFKEFLC